MDFTVLSATPFFNAQFSALIATPPHNCEMGNFCLGDAGGYGIADQPPKGPHFRPRARTMP